MHSAIMQEVIQLVEAEVQSRPTPFEFELAYQVRVAIDRIKFAIKHTEQFCPRSEPLREAGLELADALERLQSVDRRFQQRSRIGSQKTPAAPDRSPASRNGILKEALS